MKKEYKIIIHTDSRIKKKDIKGLMSELLNALPPYTYKYMKIVDIEEKELEGQMYEIQHI